MIDSLLVANRGEIAVRIFTTCRRLGIRTIAVYSDADARALHVGMADAAYRLGPAPAADSYLNIRQILAAADQAQAAAIHPGYGFLSENSDFAEAVLGAGLIWVGPPPEAMRALGDKARARALAEQHDVALLPGYHGPDQSQDGLTAQAARIGYPVLIKAAAGGGGRGMRVVDSQAAFAEALAAARREAQASFGNDRVLLERYVRHPRHVEIQIFGDQHGELVHLGERECSIQRRHQKLIEESPSPGVSADLRARMAEAALRLGRAAGYSNAGTVEFLLDEQGQFAFLEVNARLQVEHPVTEMVTGLDLVEWQLRVAAGEPLPRTQEQIQFGGHALEVRVIAEDALRGFLPSSGRVERFSAPECVRVDTWLADGATVSPHYDSLLAKLIAHAPDRAGAIRLLCRGLRATWIDGLVDNVDLLLATLEHPAFAAGELHTGFLDEHQVMDDLGLIPAEVMAAASAFDFLALQASVDPWQGRTAWRLGRVDQPAEWRRAGAAHTASVSDALKAEGVQVQFGSQTMTARALPAADGPWRRIAVDGRALSVCDSNGRRVVLDGKRSYRLRAPAALSIDATVRDRVSAGGHGRLSAPMPARVVKISVTEGDHVSQNQPLVVLEAMKMEHVLEAPHAGVVTELCVSVGEQVQNGARLLSLGSAEAPLVG